MTMRLPAQFWTLIIVYLSTVSQYHANGQSYFFDQYTTKDGLESSKIFSMCQMDDGYIWLGTDVGLSRFDGMKFDNYTIKNGIGSGSVRVLYQDKEHHLWIGHEGGAVSRYDGKKFDIINSIPANSNITSICEDSTHAIWITTYSNGTFKIPNPSHDISTFKPIQYSSKELSDIVFNSYVSPQGAVYMITDIGIKQFNDELNQFENYTPAKLDNYFQFSVMFEDSKQNKWFGTYNGGLYKYIIASNQIQYFDIKSGLASNWITDIIEDAHGNIWTSHWDMELRGGLTRISPSGQMKVFNEQNGLTDNRIWCLMKDFEGNILAGTTEQGLAIFKGELFVNYSIKNGIVNNQVNAICQDDKGNYWFGTNGGISVLNNETKQVNSYTQQSNQISNQIRFLKADNNGNIWIGTEDQGVQQFNFRQNRFISMPEINIRLPRVSKSIHALEIDQDNTLWIGTLDGVITYDINADKILQSYSQIDSLASNEIKSIFCDDKNNMWVGTKEGLSMMKNGAFKTLNLGATITPNCITQNSQSQIIVGTEAHGVFVLENETVVNRFSIQNGLFSNNIRSVAVDANNNIYVGSTIGMSKIIASLNVVAPYSIRDGFTGIETKPNATYCDLNGNIWFGTIGGATCFNPSYDIQEPIMPNAKITELHVNGQLIDLMDDMSFQNFQNNILINYSSITITNPTWIKYKIKLEGVDTQWEDVGNNKIANYRALPPGHYVFKVLASNTIGLSNNNPSTLDFIILAPIYQRPWFIALSVLFILAAIVIFIIIRERNLVNEKKILAEKVEERTIELSNANILLADKNKDITDSIQYARRIQFAILPGEIPFENSFVFFQPKDIVSGDFFWAGKHGNKEFLAVVDCTGHGVPGAFMSVIGYTSLNKIIIEKGIRQPSDILQYLNEEVSRNLHQKEDDFVNDGMDLSLISYDAESRLLEYAGANNPLWIIRNNEIIELKANRFSIGHTTGADKIFTNQTIAIEPNDMIYLFTDGYADQFGGINGKKFKTAGLKAFLIENNQLTVSEQCDFLKSKLMNWKADFEQVDDILIVGRRFV